MDKENDNVARRLGSPNHYESGDKIMYSMPESASGNEPISSNEEEQDKGFLLRQAPAIATLSAAFFASIIVSIIISRMWDEDEIKLHLLDILIRFLQSIARLCGGWAIECEKTYNDYVNALH